MRGTIFKIVSTILDSIPIKKDNFYSCIDTQNIFQDSESSRNELQNCSWVFTDANRLVLSPSNGDFCYVYETNILWTFTTEWIKYVQNSIIKYPDEYYLNNESINKCDSFSVIPNGFYGTLGKLLINPVINDITSSGQVCSYPDLGKFIFYGKYYYIDQDGIEHEVGSGSEVEIATRQSLGVVMIGDGLEINSDGLLSIGDIDDGSID